MKSQINVKGMIEYPKEGILSKVILKSSTMNVTLFCMAKGTEIGSHTSTKEGIVQVLEGDGIFSLKNEPIKMQEGVFIHMPKNAVHSLSAKKNTSFLLILC